jgi:hypothetical protein
MAGSKDPAFLFWGRLPSCNHTAVAAFCTRCGGAGQSGLVLITVIRSFSFHTNAIQECLRFVF